MRVFADRTEAGRLLAEKLAAYGRRSDVVVLGLPRGGVVVAYEVARALDAPLDVYVVRKLGVPGQEELAFGAIASGGVRVLNPDVVRAAMLDQARIDAVAGREQSELERREVAYRGDTPPLELAGKTVIVVDDGLATGASMRTAIRSLEAHHPARIVMAVPTAPRSTCRDLEREVDEAVCLGAPECPALPRYADFSQTTTMKFSSTARRPVSRHATAAAAGRRRSCRDDWRPRNGCRPRPARHTCGCR
jgi:predicted phosphoribosyltransferase